MRSVVMSAAICLLPCMVTAQTNPAAQAGRRWRLAHERAIIDEFVSLLSLPNIARDRENIQRNAEAIARMLEEEHSGEARHGSGVEPDCLRRDPDPGCDADHRLLRPLRWPAARPQGVEQPPFEPTLRDGPLESGGKIIRWPLPAHSSTRKRGWYARSAADDKAPIVAILAAIDAIRAAGLTMRSNIKFAFEGEEEAGSTNLETILAANKELFSGDVWLMCDGPVHQTRRQSIVFGARSGVTLDLTVYGPRMELHSGHYGNWAPNPALMLARLLTSMKDESGRVLVEHFYDDIEPLTDSNAAPSPRRPRSIGS